MFYFIEQETREGDREYRTSWTEEANSVEDLEKIYNVEHEECGVDVDNGEIFTEDINTRTMTQHEFDVVSRFC
jgi:hypothetical protein